MTVPPAPGPSSRALVPTRLGWDAAVIAVVGLTLALAWLADPPQPAGRLLLLAGIGLLVGAYLGFFRLWRPVPAARAEAGGTAGAQPESAPRMWGFVAAAAVALTLACAASSNGAFLQALAYPVLWTLAVRVRDAVIGCVVIGLAVCVGMLISTGSLVAASTSGLASLGFAIAMGLWISRIAEYGNERAALVDELVAAQETVRALSAAQGASAERERLARDIHDTLAQTLAGLVLLSERAAAQARRGEPADAAATMDTVERTAREALAEAREIVARTAAVPADATLGQALQRLAERFRVETGLVVHIDGTEALPTLDPETQVVLLRCAQEALANVRKHAAARRARLELSSDAAQIVLTVADDGQGFDPAASRHGFGLDGMRERVALSGGTFEVVAAPGEGTRLTVRLPLRERAAEVDA